MRGILLAVFLLVLAVPAQAQMSRYTCGLYFTDSEFAPPEARELLEPGSAAALRTCSIAGDPETRYFEYVSAPLRERSDLCQIVEERIYKHESGWRNYPPSADIYNGPPRVSMMLTEEKCPRQDDPRYVSAENVSAGLFRVLVRYWEQMISSDDGRELLATNFSARAWPESAAKEVESAIRGGALALAAVRLNKGDAWASPSYRLELGRPLPHWALEVDLAGEEIEILGYGEIVY